MKNVINVSSVEAKTKFYELLERVSDGVEITITKHEKPVAKLVPFERPSRMELVTLFQQINNFGAAHPLNPKGVPRISYRDLINGRRVTTKIQPEET